MSGPAKPTLLIVFHTQSGRTGRLCEAVARGARREDGTKLVVRRAFDATAADLVECSAVIFGTPENFGYMSGALKDFFDRTYDATKDRTPRKPWAMFVSAGNDGTGAIREVSRIALGYGLKQVADPVLCVGEVTDEHERRCEELGHTLAAGLALDVF